MLTRRMELIRDMLSHHSCGGIVCTGEEFPMSELRWGRETVGRGIGFYCRECFAVHCEGREWDNAVTLRQSIGDFVGEAGVSQKAFDAMFGKEAT